MKFKGILTLCLAGAAFGAFAQTHIEGEEYYKADQFENAKDLLLRSLNNASTDKAVADYYLGMIAVEEGKNADAAKYFDQGVAANPQYAYNYVGQGLLKLLAGDYKSAETLFKTADKNSKKDASLQIAIARAYDRANPALYAKQIAKQVEKARKISMSNPDIYIFEGDQFKVKKDWGSAGAQYEMAISYDQNYTPAYVKYANLFTDVNPQYAITKLRDLLSVNPASALGQRELANAYYNKNDFAGASAQYAKYVQNPSHFKSDENRYAFLLFYSKDYQKGYDYATKLLQEDPKNFTAQRFQFMNAAQIESMRDQLLPLAEALYANHKADKKNNKFAAIDYTLIASEFQNAKRYDDAIEVLNEGIKDMPDFADFNRSLSNVYLDMNNLTETANAYEGYLAKVTPGYNDLNQGATYDFYAGVENGPNPTVAAKYFEAAGKKADKMKEIMPNKYKPAKIHGDVAKQTADKANATKAAVPFYEEAVALLEADPDKARYGRDAKEMYMYLGNYYYDNKNDARAKTLFNKVLEYDPNNDQLRKWVSDNFK